MVFAFLVLCMPPSAMAGEGEAAFKTRPEVSRTGGNVTVSFVVDKATDVEVAILNAQGKIVRHLAAGVLGAENPPAPLKSGLSQSITWDGKDDYGAEAKGGPFKARVRAGMGVKLEQIVGGDPYAYLSDDMNQGNHTVWKMTGLEQKPDGTVYVLGNSSTIGPPALRAYDADGNYLRTVFPPPAGMPAAKMKGWGIYANGDGTWTPQFKVTSSVGISQTLLVGDRMTGGLPSLLKSPDSDSLLVRKEARVMTIGTDGSCMDGETSVMVSAPNIEKGQGKGGPGITMTGPVFDALSADGKTRFLSGIYKGFQSSGNIRKVEGGGFWRDGTVWKVDIATGKASVFYAMDAKEVITDVNKRAGSFIGSKYGSSAAFHGVAVDREGRVFLCDRQHKRVLVLSPAGEILRTLPVEYPDAIALSPDEKSLYVTIRVSKHHWKGEIKGATKVYRFTSGGKIGLIKFNDWQKDDAPSVSVDIAGTGHEYTTGGRSHVLATKSKDGKGVNVWIAYHTIPVRIYEDLGNSLQLRKDFMQASKQTCLDLQRIAVDSQTESVYIPDGYGSLFRVADWSAPQFVRCCTEDKKPINASSAAVDPHNRFLYSRNKGKGLGWAGSIKRYGLDGAKGNMVPTAPVGKTGKHSVTDNNIQAAWHITWGDGDRGLAVGPDGSVATLDRSNSAKEKNVFAEGQLRIFKRDETKVPWSQLDMKLRGKRLGAIRYDLKGNLYVGIQKTGKNVPGILANYRLLERVMGVILKFEPTGSLADGDLYPTAPKGPAKTYDVPLGAYGNKWFRTPRFGIDGWGRIYYPTSIIQKVNVIDNAGNEVISFGKYGNRDFPLRRPSPAGYAAPGEGPRTEQAVYMAYPNAVDVTDDYIYVGDMGNCRLLRIAKTFAAAETVELK